MENSGCRKLWNFCTTRFCYRFGKGFGVTKHVKILNLKETGASFRQKLIFTDNPNHCVSNKVNKLGKQPQYIPNKNRSQNYRMTQNKAKNYLDDKN